MQPVLDLTVARAVFGAARETVVLVLDRELARDHLAVYALAHAAERARSASGLAAAVLGLAESLGWAVCSEARPDSQVMTVARA